MSSDIGARSPACHPRSGAAIALRGSETGHTYERMDPVVNCEELIGKTAGHRRMPADALTYAGGLQRTLGQLVRLRIKRGVYRFHSHEEADQWLMERLTRKPAN